MSANPKQITASDVIKYLGTVLNIDTNSSLIVLDITEDLSEVNNLVGFKKFIKEKFMEEKYKYFNGYQKFLVLLKDYKKNEKVTLDSLEDFKVRSYTDKLLSRVTDLFFAIQHVVRAGDDIRSNKISRALYLEFGEDKKALKVLEAIGNREDILKALDHGVEFLRNKIMTEVYRLTITKKISVLQLSSKQNTDKKVLEMIKKRGESELN